MRESQSVLYYDAHVLDWIGWQLSEWAKWERNLALYLKGEV